MEREERLRMVIDTNVLIGALVKDNSFKARFLKDRYFQFFFPDYGLLEIEKFRDYICLKRERKSIAPSFDFAIKFLLDSVTTIPQQLYKDQMSRACEEMAAIDQKDTPFLALALHLECPLWSDDTHLKRQTLVPCYTTAEISRLLDKKDC